jgi:hypothetical protein
MEQLMDAMIQTWTASPNKGSKVTTEMVQCVYEIMVRKCTDRARGYEESWGKLTGQWGKLASRSLSQRNIEDFYGRLYKLYDNRTAASMLQSIFQGALRDDKHVRVLGKGPKYRLQEEDLDTLVEYDEYSQKEQSMEERRGVSMV